MLFADLCGWIGMIALLIAYWLVSNDKIAGRSYINQWINLFGAVTVGYNSYAKTLWAVVVLDAFWGGVALVTLTQMFLNTEDRRPPNH